ncbi:MAG: peroxiredoxin [Pseudomonadota bacterium]
MTIKIGERIPSVDLWHMQDGDRVSVKSDQLFAGKRTALFALPGAFTSTCSAKHLPGFVNKSDEITGRGIDQIVCLSVNDANVMDAWGKQHGADGKVLMVSDGNAEYSRAIGLEVDLSVVGMGIRSQRYSMIIDDGVVEQLNLEAPGDYKVSGPETILASL